jgi:hypothetical protein
MRDISGKIIITGETNQSVLRLATDNDQITPGIYLLQIETINKSNEIVRRYSEKLIHSN